MPTNIGIPELAIGTFALAIVVLWAIGVSKLFQKGHPALGWISIIGIVLPVVALLGFAGWFIAPRSSA